MTHGLTDALNAKSVARYVLLASAPIPDGAVTPLFFLASVQHFSRDVGERGSILLHALLVVTSLACSVDAAFSVLTCYMLLVHLPLHYASALSSPNEDVKIVALLGFASAFGLAPFLDDTFVFDETLQRLVAIHVLNCEEAALSARACHRHCSLLCDDEER